MSVKEEGAGVVKEEEAEDEEWEGKIVQIKSRRKQSGWLAVFLPQSCSYQTQQTWKMRPKTVDQSRTQSNL